MFNKNIKTLNKKNVEAFANSLYNEKDNVVSFKKLCVDRLKQPRQSLHCAIGEAYLTFVNSNMSSLIKSNNDYNSKFNMCDGRTGRAIDALVKISVLKDTSFEGQKKLASVFDRIVLYNDTTNEMERAKKVSDAFKTLVAPLLK